MSESEEDYEIILYEVSQEGKGLTDYPSTSGPCKHFEARWHYFRVLVGTENIKIVHVESRWQYVC